MTVAADTNTLAEQRNSALARVAALKAKLPGLALEAAGDDAAAVARLEAAETELATAERDLERADLRVRALDEQREAQARAAEDERQRVARRRREELEQRLAA